METTVTATINDDIRTSASFSRPLARITIASATLGVFAIAAMHVLRADLDPSWHVLSEYAIAQHGWVMTLAFFAYALSWATLVVLLLPHVRGIAGRIGLAFLCLAVIGVGMGGAFPMVPLTTPPEQASTSAMLHNIGSLLGNPGFIVGALLITRGLKHNPAWAGVRVPLLVFANLTWVAFVLMFVSIATVIASQQVGMDGIGLVGLANRLGMLAYAGFVITAALPLARR
jgi:hypothetical protein